MALLWVLRIALYLQFLLGFARLSGMLAGSRIWDAHLGLGILIVVLAVFALRPLPGVPGAGLRQAARFFPLLPLAVGLGFTLGALPRGHVAWWTIHVVLGLAAIGLVEAAAGRQRRAASAVERPHVSRDA
jgi:hypothetical protein